MSLGFAHIADGGQFLSCVALFQQRPGVLAGIAAVVVHGEFGAHEVGPEGIHAGQLLSAFFTSQSCQMAEAKAMCLKQLGRVSDSLNVICAAVCHRHLD